MTNNPKLSDLAAKVEAARQQYALPDGLQTLLAEISTELQELAQPSESAAEDLIHEKDQRYRHLFERNLMGIYRSNLAGEILDCNEAFAHLLGYSCDELMKLHASALYHNRDDRQRFLTALQEKGSLTDSEWQMRHKDGTPVWLLEEVTLVEEGDDTVIQGSAVDITKRKMALDALAESEEKFRCLVEQSHDGIVLVDEQGRILEWNQAQEDITGRKRATVLGCFIWDIQYQIIVDELQSPAVYANIKAQAETLLVEKDATWLGQLTEHQLQRPDGSRCYVQVLTFPISTHNTFMIGSITRDITDQRQFETALHESESQSRALLEALPDLMFCLSYEGKYMSLHAYREDELYTRPELMLDHHVSQVLPPAVAEMFLQNIEQCLTSRQLQIFEYVLTFPDGQDRDFEARMVINNDTSVLVVVRNITERKLMQKSLRLSNERYHRAMDASGAGVWEWNVGTNEIYIDPHVKALMGYADHEIENRLPDWEKLVYADDVVAARLAMQAHLDGLKPIYEVEYRVTHKDGRIRWLLSRGIALHDAAGHIYQVVGTSTDITDLKEMRLALEESEKRYQIILNAIPDTIYRVDQDGVVLDANFQHNFVFDLPFTEIMGKPIYELVPPETIPQMKAAIRQALQTSVTEIWETTLAVEERMVDYEIRMVPIRETEVLMIGRDITERKKAAENQLERERIRLLRQFMDDTSHDLKTPITTLMTSTYLLNRMTDLLQHDHEQLTTLVGDFPGVDMLLANFAQTTVKIRGRATTLEQSALRLRRLIESMADMVRLDSDIHYTLRLEDLNSLTDMMVDGLSAEAAARHITMHYKAKSRKPLPVFVDAMELSQAIKHLIENALDYTPTDGTVTVEVYPEGASAVLEVQDTGIGIEAEHLPHIFERFYRVDKTRSTDTGGVGLGLTIVKRVVEAHKGQIEVQSQPGKGSLFRMIIPAHPR